MDITRSGSLPSGKGSAEYFTGSVRIDPLFEAAAPARVVGVSVTFEPGARTAWHTHPLGQTLIVTAGCGLAQRWGGPIEEIRPGDVIWFPPGEKHWHGAAPTTAMTHIAILEKLDGQTAEWMEKVATQREPNAFVQPGGIRVQSNRSVPEEPHQLHLSGVVPDVCGDRAALTRHPRHLNERGVGICNEVQDQSRDHHIDRRVTERDRRRGALVKRHPAREILVRALEKSLRRLDAGYRRGGTVVHDRCAERACAASYVEPPPTSRNVQPREKQGRNLAAPATDVLLVWVSGLPGIGDLRVGHGQTLLRVLRAGHQFADVIFCLHLSSVIDMEPVNTHIMLGFSKLTGRRDPLGRSAAPAVGQAQ